jgi:hypothetical protein
MKSIIVVILLFLSTSTISQENLKISFELDIGQEYYWGGYSTIHDLYMSNTYFGFGNSLNTGVALRHKTWYLRINESFNRAVFNHDIIFKQDFGRYIFSHILPTFNHSIQIEKTFNLVDGFKVGICFGQEFYSFLNYSTRQFLVPTDNTSSISYGLQYIDFSNLSGTVYEFAPIYRINFLKQIKDNLLFYLKIQNRPFGTTIFGSVQNNQIVGHLPIILGFSGVSFAIGLRTIQINPKIKQKSNEN